MDWNTGYSPRKYEFIIHTTSKKYLDDIKAFMKKKL